MFKIDYQSSSSILIGKKEKKGIFPQCWYSVVNSQEHTYIPFGNVDENWMENIIWKLEELVHSSYFHLFFKQIFPHCSQNSTDQYTYIIINNVYPSRCNLLRFIIIKMKLLLEKWCEIKKSFHLFICDIENYKALWIHSVIFFFSFRIIF